MLVPIMYVIPLMISNSILFVLLSLIFSLKAEAGERHDEIQISRNSEQQIILSAPCSKIKTATKNLSPIAITQVSDFECQANITNALPQKIQELHDTLLPHSGPNCWNTSLLIAGVIETQRSVLGSEMNYLTHSPICRELTLLEPLQLGDLIALRYYGDGPREFHGFNYINDSIAFNKFGFDQQFGYELISTNYIFSTFALGPEIAKLDCRRSFGVPSEKDCNVFAQYYRCQNRSKYLSSSEFQSKTEFLKLDSKINSLEKMISAATTGKEKWNLQKSQESQLMIQSYKENSNLGLRQSNSTNPAEVFFWQSTLEKLNSLLLQIEFLDQETK